MISMYHFFSRKKIKPPVRMRSTHRSGWRIPCYCPAPQLLISSLEWFRDVHPLGDGEAGRWWERMTQGPHLPQERARLTVFSTPLLTRQWPFPRSINQPERASSSSSACTVGSPLHRLLHVSRQPAISVNPLTVNPL